MPFHAANSVEMPIKNGTAAMTRHGRAAELTVSSTAVTTPPMMPAVPRPRANSTRGRLPLQMVQRMKLGCAWRRSAHSTVRSTRWKADGCVVVASARSRPVRSFAARFSSRGAPSAT